MRILRPVSILSGCLMLAGSAAAQISLTPPGVQTPPTDSKPAKPKPSKPEPKPTVAKKPAAPAEPAAAAAPAPTDPNVDLVYGAYQRGEYKTSFDLALKRVQ